ncbi:enoyl-CoA hydratase/isomerase family protein [Paraburkholderia sp. BR10937]|uniref:enoyl-CoA hydratase/isomerase family protein n=1 Tax=Paraburkholderia sp. BR10937 TaxID=3236994 RepID=UPI0034D1F8B4
MSDIAVTRSDHVGMIVIQRPPHNFFDVDLIRDIADALEQFDQDAQVRSVVLAADGKAFCAGAKFAGSSSGAPASAEGRRLYEQALRIFDCRKPIVAAIQGPAIGGGLGVALAADFRVACPEARFSVNFTRLGIHPGFGLSVTLPELIGRNRAELLLYTSRRIDGEEAFAIGLVNELVEQANVRERAVALAEEIAACGPLGVLASRETLRSGLAGRVRAAVSREQAEQERLMATQDFAEGVKSTAERRPASFIGR